MSPTTLSQTPGRPTVNPPDPTPEARPEVGLHRPCSRAIQVSPAVSAPGPGRARQVPRPGSAHLRRDPPRAPRPAPALRPAPRLPAASRSFLSSQAPASHPPQATSLAPGCFRLEPRGHAGLTQGGRGPPGAADALAPAPSAGRRKEDGQVPRALPAAAPAPRPRGGHPPTPRRATLPYLRVAVDAASGRLDAQETRSRPPGRRRLLVEARLRLPSDQWRGAAARGGAGPMASLLGAGSRRLPGNPPRSGFASGAPPVPRRKADSAGRSTRISLKQDVDFNSCHLKSGRRIARLSPTIAPGPGLLGSAMPGLWEGAAVTA